MLPEYAKKRLLFKKSKLTFSDRLFKFKLSVKLITSWFFFQNTVDKFIENVTNVYHQYMKLDWNGIVKVDTKLR